MIAVSNYAGSFGDNYSGGPLCGGCLPWETYPGHQPADGLASDRLEWLLGDRLSATLPDFTSGGGSCADSSTTRRFRS